MYERKAIPRGIWLMYLRKSRQDNPDETVAEVLAKHEVQLQDHAIRELGFRIPEENIYREVKSGESIDEREEIKKVLARIEDPSVVGVLVIEPQRLSRGDLGDCGRLINAFRFTHTLVITPIITYDLGNKMERKFFQDELLRGRDYLEYTKEILSRGRIAAIKRGCYIGNVPPYGYDKIKIGKDNTLAPNENADVVRTIFDLCANQGLSPYSIALQLNDMAIPAAKGGKWDRATIRKILSNPHYIGKVAFNQIKSTPVLENGEIVHKRLLQPAEEVTIADGKHPAIIDKEIWDKVQNRFDLNPPVKHAYALKNPFSGLLRCGKCGRAMYSHSYKYADTRMECRSIPRCYKSVKQADVVNEVIFVLENVEIPRLELKLKNGDGDAAKIQQGLLSKFEKQLEDFRSQEDKQFELLENGTYTEEIFNRRHHALLEKMALCQKQILETKQRMPKSVDYSERLATLHDAITILKDPDAMAIDQNRTIKKIISRIDFMGQKSAGSDQTGTIRNENNFSVKVTLVI